MSIVNIRNKALKFVWTVNSLCWISDISANIENGIRSNQLKRKEDAANELLKKSLYEFKPKKSNFGETGQGITQSIIDDKPFILKKTDDDYFPPYPENPIKIEDNFKRDNKDFIKTATELNKIDIGSAIKAKKCKNRRYFSCSR